MSNMFDPTIITTSSQQVLDEEYETFHKVEPILLNASCDDGNVAILHCIKCGRPLCMGCFMESQCFNTLAKIHPEDLGRFDAA